MIFSPDFRPVYSQFPADGAALHKMEQMVMILAGRYKENALISM
jgi:hypothetical protein